MRNMHLPGPSCTEHAELEILVDGGALCVAGVWSFDEKQRVAGLYAIYHKESGRKLGPYYASIPRAQADLKRAMKQVPASFWAQPITWIVRQKTYFDWIDKELGKAGDLIGGEWDTT